MSFSENAGCSNISLKRVKASSKSFFVVFSEASKYSKLSEMDILEPILLSASSSSCPVLFFVPIKILFDSMLDVPSIFSAREPPFIKILAAITLLLLFC